MPTHLTDVTPYKTIEEISIRKATLKAEIQKDDNKIRDQWHSLFNPPAMMSKNATASKRINSLINTSVNLVDAAILGWKLYRKFKK